jgi:hypothetical protein
LPFDFVYDGRPFAEGKTVRELCETYGIDPNELLGHLGELAAAPSA